VRAIVRDRPIGPAFGARASPTRVDNCPAGSRAWRLDPSGARAAKSPCLGDVDLGQPRDGEWMATKAAAAGQVFPATRRVVAQSRGDFFSAGPRPERPEFDIQAFRRASSDLGVGRRKRRVRS
jgi:hypothetical protein